MQIHELTSRKRVNENFMTNLAKAAGSAVKDTVGSAVQGVKDRAGQLGAQLKDPKAWVSTKAATAAKGGAQLKQQTAQYAQQLASEWAQQSKSLVDAEAKAKMAAAKTPPSPPAPPASKPTTAPGSTSTVAPATKPGAPTPAEQEKFQQKVQAALAKQPPVTEAFADLPGAKPQAGSPVDPKVNKGVGRQGNPLTSAYITAFKKWSDAKLATRESNTGETITMQSVTKEFPEIARGLNQSLVNIYNTRQDPKANEQAVTAYLTQAVTAIQKVAAQTRQENPKSSARSGTKSIPGQMDPQTAKLADAMGLAQKNLNLMKQVVDSQNEKVTSGTGSKTIDNLLVASGLLK